MTPPSPRAPGEAAVALVTAVVEQLDAGLTPEEMEKARRRLTTDEHEPSAAEVIAELGRWRPLRLAGMRRDNPSATAGRRSGYPRSDPPRVADGDPAACLTVLVSGVSMPARLSWSWVRGGPLWVRCVGTPVPAGPAVAIVGTRRPTLDGLRLAETIASGVAAAGVLVVSGLANGIDQAAHRGALAAGGHTTAVLGTGHAIDYPAGSAALRGQIATSGGVLSEYAPDRGVRYRHQFTQRNRIIAGLVDAVVVIEAGQRSGALSTATWAECMHRQVLVVPSSPSNAAAAGALGLLAEGATPVRSAQDVLDAIGDLRPEDPDAPSGRAGRRRGRSGSATDDDQGLDRSARRLRDLLGPLPEPLSALAARTGLSSREILIAVSVLEDRGMARRQGDGVMRG